MVYERTTVVDAEHDGASVAEVPLASMLWFLSNGKRLPRARRGSFPGWSNLAWEDGCGAAAEYLIFDQDEAHGCQHELRTRLGIAIAKSFASC
jgi:hypothetical protein